MIPHVRPGHYRLFAFTAGAVGEFARADVRVEAGQVNQLGPVVWNVPHQGARIAWEIGIPDRTAREFRGGNSFFHGYVWEKVSREFSNPLVYRVGQSNWSNDWNYAQSRYVRPDGRIEPHTWRIVFDLPAAPAGAARLTLAIASAENARVNVFVNGGRRPLAAVTPAVQGGNALLREGIHAKYCVEYLTIPDGMLRAGENTIALVLANVSSAANHVMYDYLSLELPESVPGATLRSGAFPQRIVISVRGTCCDDWGGISVSDVGPDTGRGVFDLFNWDIINLSNYINVNNGSLPALGGGLSWNLSQLNSDGIISIEGAVIPEPSALALVATDRSDYPNQINNCLGFPGIFRGALNARARQINEPMKLAAAKAIAACITPAELSEEYIVPSVFNRQIVQRVANAVAAAARKTRIARRHASERVSEVCL